MKKAEVIQRLMPSGSKSAYLEIGVQHGYTFHAVEASVKVAVDPFFAFDVASAQLDPTNANCTYHQVTSDVYFSDIWTEEDLFDIIFIDGHHTFNQTLKDLLSAMRCLKPGGAILVDDVMPVSYASSISDYQSFLSFREKVSISDGSWMGDVFKIPFFVQSYLPLYKFATVLENCAQMVIWPTISNKKSVDLTVEAICRLDYCDFVLASEILNLTPIDEIEKDLSLTR